MVNELKLAVVHFTHQNPMQICVCAWIYRCSKTGLLTKSYGKSGLATGPPGRRAAGRWAFGPSCLWAVDRTPPGHGPVFSKTR